MEEKKTKSFVQGALILGVANLIVKVIGAFFKIPLNHLIGDDGMGYFNIAYQIYTFMFIVATAGFPIAISKMVAESSAKGNEQDARKIFSTALRFLAIIGLAGTSLLYFFPKQLEALVSVPGSSLGILAVSPAIFFVSISSVYRGYFQGRQNMYPTAASEVIEAAAKLLVGIFIASFFMNMTVDTNLATSIDMEAGKVGSSHLRTVFASAGAISGVTIGTLLCSVLLTIIFLSTKKKKATLSQLTPVRSTKSILKELVVIAIPITIGASVSSLTSLIDMATITRRLVTRPEVLDHYAFMFNQGTKFAEQAMQEGWKGLDLFTHQASTLYGMYTGKAVTIFNLPLTLVVALGMSVVPAISASLTKKSPLEARTMTESAIRIAILFAAPCALGIASLSKEVLFLLYSDTNAQSVLAILAIAIIPVAVVSVTNAILQAYGKVYLPVINMIIGGTVKVLVNLFCIPYLGIDGAPVGTFVCYLIIAVLNVVQIIKYAKIEFRFSSFIIKPLAAALIMGAVGFVLGTFVTGNAFLLNPDANIWLRRILIAGEIGVCGIIYIFAAFGVGAIQKDDILRLPKGEKIASALTKLKLLK